MRTKSPEGVSPSSPYPKEQQKQDARKAQQRASDFRVIAQAASELFQPPFVKFNGQKEAPKSQEVSRAARIAGRILQGKAL